MTRSTLASGPSSRSSASNWDCCRVSTRGAEAAACTVTSTLNLNLGWSPSSRAPLPTGRGIFSEKIRAELADLNKELDKLSAKVESANESVKADARAKVQEIRGKVASLNERLDAVKGATESTWDDVKAGVKKAYDDVKDSFKQARQWLSEKIAP